MFFIFNISFIFKISKVNVSLLEFCNFVKKRCEHLVVWISGKMDLQHTVSDDYATCTVNQRRCHGGTDENESEAHITWVRP